MCIRDSFSADRHERAARNLPMPALDEWLLAALAACLPACAGVALGMDRVLLLACGAERLEQVMPFGSERA